MTMILTGSGTGTVGVPNSATAQNSTSGTSIDFTGIPAGTKRITVMFNGVSTNSSFVQVQLGTSSSVETTGYVSSSGTISSGNVGFVDSSTTGFITRNGGAITGGLLMTIVNLSDNLWVQSHYGSSTSASVTTGGGNKTLSGTLARIRITTVSGTATFNAGSINILYE